MNRADDEVGAFNTHLILTARRGGWCRWTVQVGSGSVADEEGMEPRRATHWGGVTGRSVDDAKGGDARRAAREQECAAAIAGCLTDRMKFEAVGDGVRPLDLEVGGGNLRQESARETDWEERAARRRGTRGARARVRGVDRLS